MAGRRQGCTAPAHAVAGSKGVRAATLARENVGVADCEREREMWDSCGPPPGSAGPGVAFCEPPLCMLCTLSCAVGASTDPSGSLRHRRPRRSVGRRATRPGVLAPWWWGAGRQAGRQASRQAGRQHGQSRQAAPSTCIRRQAEQGAAPQCLPGGSRLPGDGDLPPPVLAHKTCPWPQQSINLRALPTCSSTSSRRSACLRFCSTRWGAASARGAGSAGSVPAASCQMVGSSFGRMLLALGILGAGAASPSSPPSAPAPQRLPPHCCGWSSRHGLPRCCCWGLSRQGLSRCCCCGWSRQGLSRCC